MSEVHGGVVGVSGDRLEDILMGSVTASRDEVKLMAAEVLRRRKEAEGGRHGLDGEGEDRRRRLAFALMRVQEDLWDLTKRLREGTV